MPGAACSGGLVQICARLKRALTNSFRTDPGVDVVSASLCSTGYNNYLYQSLANARISPGTGMIAAIGNNGANGINNHGSPGNYDIVLGIGAVDNVDSVAPFSDWGTSLPAQLQRHFQAGHERSGCRCIFISSGRRIRRDVRDIDGHPDRDGRSRAGSGPGGRPEF